MRCEPRTSRFTRTSVSRRPRPRSLAVAAIVTALTAPAAVAAASTTEPVGTEDTDSTGTVVVDVGAMDKTGDGVLTVGLVVAGDSQDGGFYQGQVESVEAEAALLGMESVIVDKVNPGAAQEAFENLARQNVDLIIAGGAELLDGFIPVSESPEFEHLDFVLIDASEPISPTYATVSADENQAHYVGGVVTALLLAREGSTVAGIVGGPELDFLVNMTKAMRAGMAHVNPDAEFLVTFTGDFEDGALAQEATAAQINQGAMVIYPYLGGALDAAVLAANDAGVPVLATSVDRCADTSRDFAGGILFNPSIFYPTFLASYASGDFAEGALLGLYGLADGLGAVICDATPEEQAVIDEVVAQIESGEIDVQAEMDAVDAG